MGEFQGVIKTEDCKALCTVSDECNAFDMQPNTGTGNCYLHFTEVPEFVSTSSTVTCYIKNKPKTQTPTMQPTLFPSLNPSSNPSLKPSSSPTVTPTTNPSKPPTAEDFIVKVKSFHGKPKDILDASKLQDQPEVVAELFGLEKRLTPFSRRLLNSPLVAPTDLIGITTVSNGESVPQWTYVLVGIAVCGFILLGAYCYFKTGKPLTNWKFEGSGANTKLEEGNGSLHSIQVQSQKAGSPEPISPTAKSPVE